MPVAVTAKAVRRAALFCRCSVHLAGRSPLRFAENTPYAHTRHMLSSRVAKCASDTFCQREKARAHAAPGLLWCRRPGSNRHGCRHPRDFKSRASANFATPASACFIVSAPLHKVKDEPPPSLSRGAGRWPKALPAFLPIKIPLQQRPAANLPFEDEPSSLSGPSKAFASRALSPFSFLRQGALFSVKKRSSGKPKAALYQQKSLLHRPLLIPQNHMEAGVQKLLILFQRVYPP